MLIASLKQDSWGNYQYSEVNEAVFDDVDDYVRACNDDPPDGWYTEVCPEDEGPQAIGGPVVAGDAVIVRTWIPGDPHIHEVDNRWQYEIIWPEDE